MAVEGWNTIEFEGLLSEYALAEEPLVRKERATLRRLVGAVCLGLVAGVAAFMLGAAIGGLFAWHEMTTHVNELEDWRAGYPN